MIALSCLCAHHRFLSFIGPGGAASGRILRTEPAARNRTPADFVVRRRLRRSRIRHSPLRQTVLTLLIPPAAARRR
jgi:hypothetical protein